jgi:hypothetical protein
VAPLAQDLPLAIFERFEPPSDNAGAYSANAIIDFAGVVQAPATAGRIRLGIRMATNAGASGSLVYGQFMVREVAAATTPVPAYTDGEQEGYRWLGAPGASQTVQLEESELADYTSLTGLAPRIQRIDTSGLFQDFGSGGHGQSNPLPATIGGEYAHTAREPVPDGETLVAGRLETATASYSGFLTPGLRYHPDDGFYLYATIGSTGDLELWRGRGSTDTFIISTAASSLPAAGDGKTYYMIIRAEGDLVTAEWYSANVPDAARSNYVTRLQVVLGDASVPTRQEMGTGRVGYPVIRGRKMSVGSAATVTRFDWRPYVRTGRIMETTIPLRGIPGTAPALLKPFMGSPGGSIANIEFAALAWRSLRGRQNVAANGDGKRLGGWAELASATITAGFADAPTGPGAYGLVVSNRITAHATNANSGATHRIYRPFEKGQTYTIEAWVKAATADFTMAREEITTAFATNVTPTIQTITAGAGWVHVVASFQPPTDLVALGLKFTTATGGATKTVNVTGIRIWAGDVNDAPTAIEHTAGRGAAAPFGILQAENTIDRPSTAGGGASAIVTTDPTALSDGIRLNIITDNTRTAGPGATQMAVCEYWLDPRLLVPPDFAGDSIDVGLFAAGTIDSGVIGARMIASVAHEADPQGAARLYTREFGSAGRQLIPGTPIVRAGYTSRLGTLTLGIRDGRTSSRATGSSPHDPRRDRRTRVADARRRPRPRHPARRDRAGVGRMGPGLDDVQPRPRPEPHAPRPRRRHPARIPPVRGRRRARVGRLRKRTRPPPATPGSPSTPAGGNTSSTTTPTSTATFTRTWPTGRTRAPSPAPTSTTAPAGGLPPAPSQTGAGEITLAWPQGSVVKAAGGTASTRPRPAQPPR